MPLIHFLLIYDRRRGQLIEAPREFSDAAEAASAYAELEEQHRDDQHLEIVLVGSDSLDTIRRTHGNYFDDDGGLASRRFVREIAAG